MAKPSAKVVARSLAPYLQSEFERYVGTTPDRLRMAMALAELLPLRSADDPPIRLRDFYLEDHLDARLVKRLSQLMAADRAMNGAAGLRHYQHCSVCRAVVEAEAARLITARAARRLRHGEPAGDGRKIPEAMTDQSRAYMRGPKSRF